MWIKNCFLYQVSDRAWISELAQGPSLDGAGFTPCMPTQPVSLGLVPPVPGETELQYITEDVLAWRAQRQERLLPGSVLNELTLERVAALTASEDRRVSRSERTEIKENLKLELLPKAFTRTQWHTIFLHRPTGWLMVESGSETRADELTALLRDTLGGLPVVPLSALTRPEPVWTQWLRDHDFPEPVELLNELVLVHPDEEATVRLKRVPPDSPEVGQLLTADYRPRQVQMNWDDTFTVHLDSRSVLRRLTFSDQLQEEADTGEALSEAAEWTACAHLMVGSLAQFADWHLANTAIRDPEAAT